MDNFEATDEQRALVAQMAACGIPVDDIALAVENGVPPALLYTNFARELATGAIRANVRVGDALFKLATDGNPTAAIFWAKTRMGWRGASLAWQ